MAEYRDELEAARARITTLEAQVREKGAELEVREAELREAELVGGREPSEKGTRRQLLDRGGALVIGAVVGGGLGWLAGLRAAEPRPAPEERPRWQPREGAKPVALVVPHGDQMCALLDRLIELGYRRGSVWGDNFRGWDPESGGEQLVIAVVLTQGAPFDEATREAYLPKPWEELAQGTGPHGQVSGDGPDGRRVTVVYGRTTADLWQGIGAMTL